MSRETAPTPKPQDQEKKPDPEQPQEELDDSDFVLVVNRKKPEYRKQRQSENNDETHSQASYNGRRRKYRDRGGTGERRRKGKENKENVQMKDKEKEPVSPQPQVTPPGPTVRSFSVVVAGGVAAKATQTQEPELLTNLLGMKVKDNTSGSSSIPDTSSLTSEENDSRRDLESVEGSNGSSVVVEYVDAPVPKVNPWGKKITQKEMTKEVDKQVDKIDKPAPVEPKLPEKPVEVLVPEMKPVYIREMANGFRPGRGRGSYSGYASAGRKIPSRSSALLKQLGGGEWPTLVEAVGTKGGDEDQVDSHAVGEKEKVKPTQSPPPAQPPSSPSPEPQPHAPETSSSDNDEESGGKRRGSKVKWLPVDMSSQTEAPVQQQQENKKSGKWKPKGGGSHYYERGGYNRARGKENVHVNGGGDYSDYPQYNPRYTQRQPRNHRGHNPRRRHNPPPHRSNSTLSLNNHGAVAIPPHYEVTVMSAPPDFQDFSPDFTTLTPMYPAAVSDFIMPYVANGYFPTPFTPPPGVIVEPEIGAVVVTSFGNDVVDAVRTQIEYYFSEINLTKDIYLRRNMNHEGYLQITLLQEFPRIRQLTKDYGTVLTAIQQSDALELNPDHTSVRTRLNPESWPLPTVCINNNNTPVESLNPNVPEFVPKMKVGS